MSHTPEPWSIDCGENYTAIHAKNILITKSREPNNTTQTNLARIVQCVNACAGMVDPAAEIAKLKANYENLLEEKVYAELNDDEKWKFIQFEVENERLKSDKARLVGALRETTKYLGTSAELLIGTLKHTNEKLLTEMK